MSTPDRPTSNASVAPAAPSTESPSTLPQEGEVFTPEFRSWLSDVRGQRMLEEVKAQRILLTLLLMGGAGLAVYLLMRRHQGSSALAGMPAPFPPHPPIQILNYSLPGGSMPALPAPTPVPVPVEGVVQSPGVDAADDMSGPSLETRLFSTTLSATQPTRLFTASGGKFWRIQARTVSLPGSFAILATEPNALRNTGNIVGDALVVPVGQFNEIVLKPRQTLYGRGSVANVVVSIAASVERT